MSLRWSVVFKLLVFLSILYLSVASAIPPAISTLNMTTSLLTARSSELRERNAQYTLRNMHFCTFSFDRNICVMASHFVEATGEAELMIYNYNCLMIGWIEGQAATKEGMTIVGSSALPNDITYHVSEWWPTFEYEGANYNDPTCVEDSRGGASGCWQTFTCEERQAVA